MFHIYRTLPNSDNWSFIEVTSINRSTFCFTFTELYQTLIIEVYWSNFNEPKYILFHIYQTLLNSQTSVYWSPSPRLQFIEVTETSILSHKTSVYWSLVAYIFKPLDFSLLKSLDFSLLKSELQCIEVKIPVNHYLKLWYVEIGGVIGTKLCQNFFH